MSYNETHSSRKDLKMLKFLFHLFMTFATGGLWLIGLIVWHVVKK